MQHGVNLQFAGWTDTHDEYFVVRGSIESRRFTACAVRDDRLVGAIGVGHPKDIRQVRTLIASAGPVDRNSLEEGWLDRPHAVVR